MLYANDPRLILWFGSPVKDDNKLFRINDTINGSSVENFTSHSK